MYTSYVWARKVSPTLYYLVLPYTTQINRKQSDYELNPNPKLNLILL